MIQIDRLRGLQQKNVHIDMRSRTRNLVCTYKNTNELPSI